MSIFEEYGAFNTINNHNMHQFLKDTSVITHIIVKIILAAPYKIVSLGICGQRRPRSACASAQSDQGLHCPLAGSLGTIKCLNGVYMPERNFAHSSRKHAYIILTPLNPTFI